ncbi:LysE family translocator [Paraburkholderia sp. LEh10]|uniref:LysE family translocator n=1 Tax=Paraburkholderia sp. LEh10 TaxID=2821353 RepID=UPI001AEA13C5|nr:LysE family translocator [Paraburkholderia sp. LEh10]MBP0589832.1 LysE family translocator [Paraburkholderia sp. LEh10]
MFGISQFPLFLAAVTVLNLTPGPDIAYVAGQSIAQGRRSGLLSAVGVAFGGCMHTVACALGMTAVLAASPGAFNAIKWIGAAYLMYLGLRMLWPSAAAVAKGETPPAAPHLSRGTLLFRGFVTNASNPKVLLFYIAFFPQFVAADSPHKTWAFLVLGAVFVTLGLINDCVIAWLAATAARAVRAQPRVRRWIDRVVGAGFIGLGVRLALTKR